MKKISPQLKQLLNEVFKDELKELRKHKSKPNRKKRKKTVQCLQCKKAILSEHGTECWCPEQKEFKNPFMKKSCKLFTNKH